MGVVITRETDYALRILRALGDGEKHLTADVAESCMIPLAFTYKIIIKLREANLIEVTRGAQGGIRAACDYHQATVLDVFEAMGEELVLNDCLRNGAACEWREQRGSDYCHVHHHLHALQDTVLQSLSKLTLADLLFDDVCGA